MTDEGQDGGDQGAGDGGRSQAAGQFDPPLAQVVEAVLKGVAPRGSDKGGGADGQSGDWLSQAADAKSGQGQSTYSPTRLQRAASEVIAELHAAKQELAKELEANLKQLKAVLKETQKIAKDMEAVLREAQAKPSDEEKATGNKQGGKQNQQQERWEPPTLKKSKGKQQQQDDDQQSEDDNQDDDQNQMPEWSPPQDALHPQH